MNTTELTGAIKDGVAGAFTEAIKPIADNIEKLEQALADIQKPGVRAEIEGQVGAEVVDKAEKGGKFLRAVALGKATTDYMENATTDGAHFTYSVPTEILPDVIAAAVQESIALRRCTSFPQRAQTVHRLVYSSGYTMSFPDEGASATAVVGTHARVIFSKKRGALLVAATNDLLEGSVVDMYNEFVTRFGKVYGSTVDTYAFNDNSSPFNGILYGAGNSVTMGSSATLSTITSDALLEDLMEMVGKLSAALMGSVWVFSPTVHMKMRSILKDTTGVPLPIWERRQPGDAPDIGGYLIDYPYIVSDVMPTSTTCASASTATLFIGNLADYHIGKASEFAVKTSNQANESLDSTQVSAFSADLTYFLGQAKWSQNIALSGSFCKLETGS